MERHAGATEVVLTLAFAAESVELVIHDDGVGVQASPPARQRPGPRDPARGDRPRRRRGAPRARRGHRLDDARAHPPGVSGVRQGPHGGGGRRPPDRDQRDAAAAVGQPLLRAGRRGAHRRGGDPALRAVPARRAAAGPAAAGPPRRHHLHPHQGAAPGDGDRDPDRAPGGARGARVPEGGRVGVPVQGRQRAEPAGGADAGGPRPGGHRPADRGGDAAAPRRRRGATAP